MRSSSNQASASSKASAQRVSPLMAASSSAAPLAASNRMAMSCGSTGSLHNARPRRSNTQAISKPSPPRPPADSSASAAKAPISLKACHAAALLYGASNAAASRAPMSQCSASRRSSASLIMRRSSVGSKFIGAPPWSFWSGCSAGSRWSRRISRVFGC